MEIQFMFPQFYFKVLVFSDVSNYNMKKYMYVLCSKAEFYSKSVYSEKYNIKTIIMKQLLYFR